MALFPASPTNGQTANVNGISYVYNSSQTAWIRSSSASSTDLAVTGNISASGNVTASFFIGNGSQLTGITAATAGTVTTAAQPNITSVGTLTSLGVNGTVTAVAFTANTGVFTGNGSGLSAIAGANVTGTVSSATSATTAGTVTTNAQPNITSVGTLTSLAVTGNVTANNFVASNVNLVTSNSITIPSGTAVVYASQQGGRTYVGYDMNTYPSLYESRFVNFATSTNVPSGASGIGYWFAMGAGDVANRGFDLLGTSANAMYFRAHDNGNTAWVQLVSNVSGTAVSATTAGTVTTAAQPNITSTGTLTSLTVSGNVNFDSNTLFVDSVNNNVGIGTSSPQKKLAVSDGGNIGFEVSPNDAAQGYTRLINYNRATSQYTPVRYEGSTQTWYVGTAGATRAMDIDSSGNVGVGINSPQTALEVYRGAGTAAYLSLIGNNGVASQLYVGQDAAGLSRIFQNGANPITVWTNGTERMRIDSSGNVGIGNTNPGSKLTVAGTIESTTGGVKFPDGTTQTSAGINTGKSIAMAMIFGG